MSNGNLYLVGITTDGEKSDRLIKTLSEKEKKEKDLIEQQKKDRHELMEEQHQEFMRQKQRYLEEVAAQHALHLMQLATANSRKKEQIQKCEEYEVLLTHKENELIACERNKMLAGEKMETVESELYDAHEIYDQTKQEFDVMQRVADEMERKIRAEINGQDIDV